MSQFGFYRVGAGVQLPLAIVIATSVEDAKRQAVTMIETEGLDAVRLWIDGQKTIEIRRPVRASRQIPLASPSSAQERGARMAAMKAQGATQRAIGKAFGISAERVRNVVRRAQARAELLDEQPNRAALSVRARNALPYVIEEPEEDRTELDKRLPCRVAALTRADIGKVPNLGKQTIAELEAWLWERGLSFSG